MPSALQIVLALTWAVVWPAAATASPPPRHLAAALELVTRVRPRDTSYRHGAPDVRFSAGEGGARCHTDCSGFIDRLLRHCAGYTDAQMRRWFGRGRPLAAQFYGAIRSHRGFSEIAHVADAKPGDLLVVRYGAPSRDRSTGHVMLLIEPARPIPGHPTVRGLTAWAARVVDSARSGHGAHDSRNMESAKRSGLGCGEICIWVDPSGAVGGYSWSTTERSRLRSQRVDPLVIGRLVPDFRP